jgi:hypothetical protein
VSPRGSDGHAPDADELQVLFRRTLDPRQSSIASRMRAVTSSRESIGAVLGNDVAIKAYREGKLPFPDGTIIAALHYGHVPSEENNKVFGQAQSFVPGPPTNIQFMVKDSTKYAATGGWGFATFIDGKPAAAASMKSCFSLPQSGQG